MGLRTLALILALSSLLGIVACGGGGSSTATITSVTVSCTPTSVQSGQTSSCTATVTGTGSFATTVTWGASAGSVDVNGVFTAQAVTASTAVTVNATSTQDATKTASTTVTVTPVTAITVSCSPTIIQPRQSSQCVALANGVSTTLVNWSSTIGTISVSGLFTAPQVTAATQATNTAPIAVDGGPTVNGVSVGYPNGAYATVTVCTPGTTTCQTIDHVLVDTGSVGF